MPIKDSKKKLAFVCFPKTHLLDMAGPAHVFYEAVEYGAEYQLSFLKVGEEQVQSSSGLFFTNLTSFKKAELKTDDVIFVPGFDTDLLFDKQYMKNIEPFIQWLREMYNTGVCICSVCTGAFVLGEAGLLDNRNCTTHWKHFDVFEKRFPKAQLLKNRLFVDEHNIYSSAGISSGIDLSLYIIEKDYGSKFALDIAREVVVYMRRGEDDPQLSIFLKYRNHLEDKIHTVQDFIIQHIGDKISLETLADKVHYSERNLTRLFKNTTGITIGEYIDQIRIERAVHLIKEENKMSYVADQCGFQTTNQLYKLLNKHGVRVDN